MSTNNAPGLHTFTWEISEVTDDPRQTLVNIWYRIFGREHVGPCDASVFTVTAPDGTQTTIDLYEDLSEDEFFDMAEKAKRIALSEMGTLELEVHYDLASLADRHVQMMLGVPPRP